ncbi:MAG TPA: NAD(P)/FAD-dependent oxidoreductase [Polyangiaceae bacterium]|jgi:geranylgeranyl reductase family protein|nr:NAD(P)/FAD-dependent oxidoreductase [Polyangiaceae bacterium]
MASSQYDVIVIGGGPAGAAVATRLSQRGRRVVLLEKERFPRFHIGESMLPCSMPLIEELGAMPRLKAAEFLPKYAAEFVTADGSLKRRYAFADGLVQGPGSAYEVDRSEFDQLLLDNAVERGVEVRQGVQVTRFELDRARGVSVVGRAEDGSETTLQAEMLIDATGQSSLLAGRLGLREMDQELKNFAVFSHFEGASRYTGDREGDISVVLIPEGWWWVIPLKDNRTSVGLVAPSRTLRGQKPDEAYFTAQIAQTPFLRERLAGATRVAPVRSVSDYSYVSRKVAGDRFVLVGDAAAFIDPVFSTGVYLGLVGAFRAAEAVDAALGARNFNRSQFVGYEREILKSVATYKRFVKGFYTPEFVDVLMSPSDWLELRAAITSLLAGYGVDRFQVNWRVLVFRAIARANKRFALVPRVLERRAVS